MYRDADFDIEDDIRSTTSCFVGLKEEARFLPDAHPKVRRTSSVDDVSRFRRHYELARRHCGKALTWRYYATVLHEGFRHFKAPKGRSVHTLCSTSTMSERSAYATAPESETSSYYSMKKISAETKHLARELVRRVDRVLHLHPRSGTPPATRSKKKRQAGHTPTCSRFNSPRHGGIVEGTSSESASSSSSIRPPCGAGDHGNRKRTHCLKDFRQQRRQ